MTRGGVHFVVSAVVVTAAFFVVAAGQRQNDVAAFHEADALQIGRTLAWAAEHAADPSPLQASVTALPKHVPGLHSALVLRGMRLVAHSDPTRANTTLDRTSDADKRLYDRAKRLRATTLRNEAERSRDPALEADAYPEVEANAQGHRLALAVPLQTRTGGDAGIAVVERVTPPVEARLPWELLAVLAVAAAIGMPLLQRAKGLAVFMLGSLGLVALLAADVALLARWRDGLRQTLMSEHAATLGHLADAGLIDAALATPDAVVAAAGTHGATTIDDLRRRLAQDVLHRRKPEFVALRPSSAPVAASSIPFPAGSLVVDVASSFFESARIADLRSLLQWAIALGAAALTGFALGIRGRVRAAWDAFVTHREAYAYLAPAMVGMLVLVFVPMLFGLVLGFTERRYNAFEFVGLQNFVTILSDTNLRSPDNFWFTLGVTVLWTGLNVLLHVGIGLFLALVLNDPMLKARGLYRVLLVVPWAIPNYVTALIWKGLFHRQFGTVNAALALVGIDPIAWFGSFWPAFSANVATNSWLGFPFMMVVALGALQSIPTDLYEAARVDGANRWQRFRHVTLPLLMPALVPSVIVGTVWTFNMFNVIYLVSGGAPDGATDILVTEAFRWAFERDRYGYAAAYSTLIFLLLVTFTIVTNRLTGATKGAFE